jgi:hypothetical protein
MSIEFGNTSVGGSADYADAAQYAAVLVTAPAAAGRITRLALWCPVSSQAFVAFAFSRNASTGKPDVLLGQTAAGTTVANSWVYLDLVAPPLVTAGQLLFLGFTGSGRVDYRFAAGGTMYYTTWHQSYPTIANPYPSSALIAENLSMKGVLETSSRRRCLLCAA